MTTTTPTHDVTALRLVKSPEELRAYLVARRAALLIELGKIEELLGMERTVTPKRKRDRRK